MDTTYELRLDPDFDDEALSWVELAHVMAEPPGGDNHGRRANALPDTDYDLKAKPVKPGTRLDVGGKIIRAFLREGGASIPFAGATGEPNGRPRTWPYGVTTTAMEAIVWRTRCEPETFARLVRQGPKAPADKVARARLARAIADVMEDGRGQGIEEALTATYGCSRSALHRLAREGRRAGR
jgi:hypothetical protein